MITVIFWVLMALLLMFIIDADMERYARKQSRLRREGKPYVNVPGAEKNYD